MRLMKAEYYAARDASLDSSSGFLTRIEETGPDLLGDLTVADVQDFPRSRAILEQMGLTQECRARSGGIDESKLAVLKNEADIQMEKNRSQTRNRRKIEKRMGELRWDIRAKSLLPPTNQEKEIGRVRYKIHLRKRASGDGEVSQVAQSAGDHGEGGEIARPEQLPCPMWPVA